MRWFFFVQGGFLWREQINRLLEAETFLRGRRGSATQAAVSKKLFSFRAGGGRVWGYARDREMRDRIITRIREELANSHYGIKTGEEVLREL